MDEYLAFAVECALLINYYCIHNYDIPAYKRSTPTIALKAAQI